MLVIKMDLDLSKRFYRDDNFIIDFTFGKVWRKRKGNIPYLVGHKDKDGCTQFKYKDKNRRLHRFLYEKFHNIKLTENQVIDHQNFVRNDNRIVNLKLVNKSGNEQNKPKRKECSSKYRGVCFVKRVKKWNSRISNPSTNKIEYLGYFDDEKEAAMAYINKAIEFNQLYHSNFNIPYLKSLLED